MPVSGFMNTSARGLSCSAWMLRRFRRTSSDCLLAGL